MTDVIGNIPYRLALAGGWIDQPFVSQLNPSPPGSMVVVSLEPESWFMERSGMATGTRKVAGRIWNDAIPDRPLDELIRELYNAENEGASEPSGSQDMIGLIYPGICRLDYDASYADGYFPVNIEQNCDPDTAEWLEKVIHMLPLAPRPQGYNPLGEKHLDAEIIQQLGETGKKCFAAIIGKDIQRLGSSMNECMECWSSLLPNTVRHDVIQFNIVAVLKHYQERYPGAMCSGCGGGYLIIASEEHVPGTLKVKVRLPNGWSSMPEFDIKLETIRRHSAQTVRRILPDHKQNILDQSPGTLPPLQPHRPDSDSPSHV